MDVMNLGLQDWVTCPFDQAHRMKYSRFYNHFVECRKKHPDDRRKQCPYNFSEMIEPEHYEKHVSECPFRSLYINMGQYTKLREYEAPSHFDIIDEPQEPLRKKRYAPNQFEDSDEEFDSVSMAGSALPLFYPQRPMPSYEEPAKPASVVSGSDKPTERRGFGRGAWIKQMMEQKKSAPKVVSHFDSVSSDETPKSEEDSVCSNDEQLVKFIETYQNNPQGITKDYGRGRGAIFRTLLRD